MKKLIAMVLALVCLLSLVGCSTQTVKIDLPFEAGDVENVEMYHYNGNPEFIEKKVVIAEDDIKSLCNIFEKLSLETPEKSKGGMITSFRFNLIDGTSYELIYRSYGVKKGNLKSSTDAFEYFTSADIGAYWSNIAIEAVQVDESELPK